MATLKAGQIRCACAKAYWPNQAWKHKDCEAHAVANAQAAVANKTLRVQTWREANRERYNRRQRELMRLKRAGFIGIAYG